MNLSDSETRVLGCMLEKQLTTPDIYPLTLNSLRLACNQSTNRDPVVDYDDATLRDALHRLERRGYVRLASGRGSRAPKYRHLLAEALPLSAEEHAVLCVLLLRGAQTPGELKQRAERMHSFGDLDEVHDTLERLIARGLVARLERRPGQKEERYEHLLSADRDEPTAGAEAITRSDSGAVSPHSSPGGFNGRASPIEGGDRPIAGGEAARHSSPPKSPASSSSDIEERVARLEQAVRELRAAVRT
jgi:uncharacterized protein YceH (UPF0502 family)